MDERTLNDLLECSVCLERLNQSSKVLPCQHTFCRKCLEVIIASRSELRCPECRILVDTRIDDLPPNVLLMRILEGMKNTTIQSNNPIGTEFIGLLSPPQPILNGTQPLNQTQLSTNVTCNDAGGGLSLNENFKRFMPISHQNALKRKDEVVVQQNAEIPQNQNLNNKQQNDMPIPYAKALYNFESKEQGDLGFKSGDKIFLRRRIDMNWFVGECNGREGVFPINYVQTMVPLATNPQCKALYDFRMGTSEEEGCLTFKKGTIINVLRRVDQNWAEGRIDDTIGIFPIAFVEMNTLAKQLVDNTAGKYTNYVAGQRNVPPTPNEQLSSFSSGSNSLTTSPISPKSSTTSSSTNTATATNTIKNGQSTVQNNAHLPTSSIENEKRNASDCNSINNINQNINRRSKDVQCQAKVKTSTQKHSNTTDKSCSQKHQPFSSTTNAFIALYPYKPHKSDELELKKGSIYFVKEFCQDGWYKGINRAQKSGVFPGNYVTPLRNANEVSMQNIVGQYSHKKRSSASNSTGTTQMNKSQNPPELPPRSSGSSLSSSVWLKPIGHVEALFGRSQSSSVNLIKRITNIKRSKSPINNATPSYSMDNPVFEDNSIGNSERANVSLSSSSKRNTIHLSQPVHVRSGSCPSQLLQSLPVEIGFGLKSNGSGGVLSKAEMFGSHRIKLHKERAALQGMTYVFGPAQMKNTETTLSSSLYHRKSQSLDAATAAQISNSPVEAAKRKSYTHNEKFKCVVSYPPNSEFELELKVGDIIYVHKKRDNGWYKGTHSQTGKVGLFPSSFVELVI